MQRLLFISLLLGLADPSQPLVAEELYQATSFTDKGLFTSGIEGPACDAEGNIYCVKFSGEHTLGMTTPEGMARLFVNLPAGSTANGLRFGPDGHLYVADYTGHKLLRVNIATQKVEVFIHEPAMSQPNDLTVARDGTFYASDPDWQAGTGRIWRISRNGKTECVADAMGTTNGLDLSPDGKTLYVNESLQCKVWAFDVLENGQLHNKRLLIEFPDHSLDGMRVDVRGNLFITRHGKGTVVKVSPKGELMREIVLPGAKPSNLCFGGVDGRTVYVTEMEGGQLLQFRCEDPGLEWQRRQDELSLRREKQPARLHREVAVPGVCAWPNLTLLPDGTLVAIVHNQPSHGNMEGDVECWSSQNGLRWEKRSQVTRHQPGTVRMNHAAGLAANGDLLVLCSGWSDIQQEGRPKQESFRDAVLNTWVMRSQDGGFSWNRSESFPEADSRWTHFIPFGDIWPGKDGALHVSCYQGELADPARSAKMKGYRSWHLRSDDDGLTWKPTGIIGANHNETDLFHLQGQSWLAAARADAVDLFRSDDDGQNWQKISRLTSRNEINAHLTRLKNGKLLLTYGVRTAGQYGVRAKFSHDGGMSWGEPLRLAHSFSWDCGYPSSVELPNGQIVTVYYSKDTPEYEGYHMGVSVWEMDKPGRGAEISVNGPLRDKPCD